MLRNNRFHSFAECLDGRHPFDAKEARQNLQTSSFNDPEWKVLLELLAERIAQLPEVPKKILAMYYCEGLHLADIAPGFNLSKTQVCQFMRKSSIRFAITCAASESRETGTRAGRSICYDKRLRNRKTSQRKKCTVPWLNMLMDSLLRFPKQNRYFQSGVRSRV